MHTFNGKQANFYISGPNMGGCSVDAKNPCDKICSDQVFAKDANYFCQSFYGSQYAALSYESGNYQNSGQMGWQFHNGWSGGSKHCSNKGEAIQGTSCDGHPCKMWKKSSNFFGLWDIVCSGKWIISENSNFYDYFIVHYQFRRS